MYYILVILALILISLLISWLNFKFARSGKRLRALMLLPFTLALLIATLISVSFILDQSTFKRLTTEHTLASIKFQNTGKQAFTATFTPAYSNPITIDLKGDQWQLDTRIMKWKGLASYLGFQPLYTFERISGRYQSVEQELNLPRSVIKIADNDSINYWNLLVQNQDVIPWLDVYYGNALYLPMKDHANFIITLGQQGLIARPRNLEASQALENWQLPANPQH
ncbi:MAG: hypothetical protein R3240_10205 [Gammaproteobacteria bacterium]|nr:hypothetical protein [Gammaproteobacteria bacterium]